MKKTIAIVLAVLMLISVIPITAGAITEDEHLSDVPEGYIGVYTKDDLYEVRTNPAGKYILMNDIVFDKSDFDKGGGFYNSGKGWEPIGTSSTPFTGIFDGSNYYIKNLYVNSDNSSGLFGYTENATIKNLIVLDANITGADYTGGIVARMKNGKVYNCVFSGNVAGTTDVGGIIGHLYAYSNDTTIEKCVTYGTIIGNTYVGGIIGHQTASAYSITSSNDWCTMIISCVNSSFVSGNDYVGGIAGFTNSSTYEYTKPGLTYNYYTSYIDTTIAQCINSGDIICTNSYSGGIAGFASSVSGSEQTIMYCCNIGNISAIDYSGGILGYFDNYISAKHSYSIGNVISDGNFGGLFGKYKNYVNYCYYLDESVTNPTSLTGIAKSSDQLVRKGTFEQWDFDSVWTMDGREDYGYPELRDVALVFPGEYPYHEHDYVTAVTTPATHLKEGVMTYTCECGDSYTEAISKTAEHTYEAVVTAPTCTEQGFTTYTCECGDSYVADYVKENDHSHTAEVTTPATHLTEGVMTYTCACGDTYTEAIAKIEGHTYNNVVTAPTCTEQGYTTYTCECGDSYVSDYVKENGHSHTANVTTPATHLTEGVMTYTCGCGDTYTETIAKLEGHTYNNVVTAPTCTEQGYTTYTCECGDSYVSDYVKENGHSYTENVTAPTCIEKGFTTYICECGDSYVADYVDIIEHKDNDGDEFCDYCDEFLGTDEEENKCSHMCHQSGFMGFIWKIINFFQKLFGINPVCECGKAHY